jgi:hypothetical protein
MTKKDEKDVMSEVINDISSAAEEAEEAAPDTAEAAAEVFLEAEPDTAEEAAGVFMEAEEEKERTPEDAETIVIKFDDDLEAARALNVLNKALRKRHESIYQGAIVKREEKKEELEFEDLRDMGMADLITGTVGIGVDLGRDSFKLVWKTATAGVGLVLGGIHLLRRTALLARGVGGSTLTLGKRHQLDTFAAQEEMKTDLEPGESAVVIVADHDTAVEIANDLIKSGGELA